MTTHVMKCFFCDMVTEKTPKGHTSKHRCPHGTVCRQNTGAVHVPELGKDLYAVECLECRPGWVERVKIENGREAFDAAVRGDS